MASWMQRAIILKPEITAKTDETVPPDRVSSVLAVDPGSAIEETAQSGSPEPEIVLMLPWRCYACHSLSRTKRPAWSDWTCDQCGVIVVTPRVTERPWKLVRRYGPVPLPSLPRVVWGQARGYIAVHDPVTDTWHEIAYRDAPVVWQAMVRRRRAGAGQREP